MEGAQSGLGGRSRVTSAFLFLQYFSALLPPSWRHNADREMCIHSGDRHIVRIVNAYYAASLA